MQLARGCALVLPLWWRLALGASLRSGGSTASGSLLQAEAEDRRFWSGQWDELESELQRLLAAVDAVGDNSSAHVAAGKEAASSNGTKRHHVNPLAGIKLNLNPKSTADLIPALTMLKSLYEEGKQNIANLNERERQSKKFIEEKEGQHKKKLAEIEAKFKRGVLSAEFRANETRDEQRSWTYWSHVRERQHHQFHTSLKIQHATMLKEKNMIEMYEKTIAGTADQKQVVHDLNKESGGTVEVVLLQNAGSALKEYCAGALAEVRQERSELQRGPARPEEVIAE